jgi:hypothetical protein
LLYGGFGDSTRVPHLSFRSVRKTPCVSRVTNQNVERPGESFASQEQHEQREGWEPKATSSNRNRGENEARSQI